MITEDPTETSYQQESVVSKNVDSSFFGDLIKESKLEYSSNMNCCRFLAQKQLL